VETALSYALSYISNFVASPLEPVAITILADNDYYSRPDTATATKGQFLDFGQPLWDAHKTGLGSSAALVTALTAALLVHYLPNTVYSISSDGGRQRLHNLAQAAHCAAQGKIGSGFDVASAVFGACLYRRFSPALLEGHGEPGSKHFAATLKALVNEESGHKWDTQIGKSAANMPKSIRMILCDVDCGSKSPGMAKKVLEWRKQHPEQANKVWNGLQTRNEALAVELDSLAKSDSRDYTQLRERIQDIRSLIREMSSLTNVPIEPPQQTQLLDACSELSGVIGGVVPGAGGYDAVALLIEDGPDVTAKLQAMLKTWKPAGAAGEETSIEKVSILGVREDMEGIRVEDPVKYDGWI